MSGGPSRSLDYATRTLIAETIRATLCQELPDAAMALQLREEMPIVLHGPSSRAAEELVLGAVLSGELPASAVPLEPRDFWPTLSQRLWRALQAAETLSGCGPEHWAVLSELDVLGLVSGPLEPIREWCETLAANAAPLLALRDLASATLLIQEHSRARKLARLLQELTYGLTNGRETHESAYISLKQHFAHTRQ